MRFALPRFRSLPQSLASVTAAALFALAAATSRAHAQDLEPRAYSNTPTGLNFLLLGYGYSQGDVTTDPSVPLTNADIEVQSTVLGYARSLDVWGLSGKFDVALPYAWVSGRADFMGQPREREVSGLGDPKLRFSVNFHGAPALSLKEFADHRRYRLAIPLGGGCRGPVGFASSGKAGSDLQGPLDSVDPSEPAAAGRVSRIPARTM